MSVVQLLLTAGLAAAAPTPAKRAESCKVMRLQLERSSQRVQAFWQTPTGKKVQARMKANKGRAPLISQFPDLKDQEAFSDFLAEMEGAENRRIVMAQDCPKERL